MLPSEARRTGWLTLIALICGAAGPMSCPMGVSDGSGSHPLDNASVFDGPPAELADLEPATRRDRDTWTLNGVDPYLVCRFRGTTTVVQLHVRGATVCEAGGYPLEVGCR